MVIKRIISLIFLLSLFILAVTGTVLAYQGIDNEFEIENPPGNGSDLTDPNPEGLQEKPGIVPGADGPFDPASVTDPDELLRIADEKIFIRPGVSESFWETQGYVNEVLDGDIIHQYFVRSGVASDLLMSMFPAVKSTRTTNSRLNFTRAWMDDYHVSFSVLRGEDIPKGAGGCWLRYSNVQTKGRGKETGLILYPEKEAYAIKPSGTGKDLSYTFVEDLSDLSLNNLIRFDFIRLSGVSYIYANGRYLFSYVDGFDGKMSFEAGSELYEGGNRVRCDFDNFTMRFR